MEGKTRLTFLTFPHEPYTITNPNVYARGVMFGRMYLEIGDVARISCESTGLFCEINFKVKVGHASLILGLLLGHVRRGGGGHPRQERRCTGYF